MADEFKEGDVVVLKSGGPKMTVSNIYSNGLINCVWFDKDQNYKEKEFRVKSVKKDTGDSIAVS